MKIKKRPDGGLKKKLILFILILFLSYQPLNAQILDYETEEFISEILKNITTVNKLNKKIKFKINSSNEINAFVDHQNTININSGLIQNCDDYVALLSVLAHEVGHIDLNHISIRKKTLENKKKYNNLTFLSIIAGSALSHNSELLQTSIIGTAALTNQYIEFSKEQEKEADLYSLNTLNLLKTNSNSVIKLLETIEQKLLTKGFSKDKQRLSTHPYFEDRILLIENYKLNKNYSIDKDLNKRFNFIKAKFIGYRDNTDAIDFLDEPYKSYAESISYARNGNLKMSLESLNKLIKVKNENSFLIETKADILFSYGFTDEAIRFYKKNLEIYPQNFYAQIRIFENIKTKNLSNDEINILFNKNKNLLYKFYNNKNILIKYLSLAKILKKNEWVEFFEYILKLNQYNKKDIDYNFTSFKKTQDKDLLMLIIKFEKTIS